MPLLLISQISHSLWQWTETLTIVACACLMTLVTASWKMRYRQILSRGDARGSSLRDGDIFSSKPMPSGSSQSYPFCLRKAQKSSDVARLSLIA